MPEAFLPIAMLAVFAGTILSGSALAHGDCPASMPDTLRLACYDAMHEVIDIDGSAGNASGSNSASSPETVSDWRVEERVNRMTDTRDVFLVSEARDTIRCNSRDVRPALILRCLSGETATILQTGCFMSDTGDYPRVTYRIDDAAAIPRTFEISTDNMALANFREGNARAFIKRMLTADVIAIQFMPFNDNPKISEFDISGLREAIAPLRESCGWR